MFRGLYTAVSGMQTVQKQLDVAANNMANVNTTGFKKDVVISEAFPEVLMKKINGSTPAEPIRNGAPVEVERDGEGFKLITQGGFFRVKSPVATSYGREVNFARDDEGYLRTYSRDIEGRVDTSEGNYILDGNGQRIQVAEGEVDVTPQGQLTLNGQPVANLITPPGRNTIGTINSGIRMDKIQTNFSQGTLEETGNNLDFAIEGKGFFKIYTPQGEMYTRSGSFTLNDNGEIITSEGHFLAGQFGSILVDGMDFQLTTRGEIVVNDEIVDRIDMVNITNVNALRKRGEGYYYVEEGVELEFAPFTDRVLQGYVEGSNINSIKEMVDMISILRSYESNQKVVKAYDDILQRAVNDIGKL